MTHHSHWLPLEDESIGVSEGFQGLLISAEGDERLSFHPTLLHQADVKAVSKRNSICEH